MQIKLYIIFFICVGVGFCDTSAIILLCFHLCRIIMKLDEIPQVIICSSINLIHFSPRAWYVFCLSPILLDYIQILFHYHEFLCKIQFHHKKGKTQLTFPING